MVYIPVFTTSKLGDSSKGDSVPAWLERDIRIIHTPKHSFMSSSEDCWKYAWVNNLLGHRISQTSLDTRICCKYYGMHGRRSLGRGENGFRQRGEKKDGKVRNHRAIFGEICLGKIEDLSQNRRFEIRISKKELLYRK